MKKPNRITPIRIEWNYHNGFIFEFMYIEWGVMDSSLLGLSFSDTYCYLDIFYFTIPIKPHKLD